MAGWRDFTEIGAWQRARELKLRVDELLARPEFNRRFKFSDQLGDAARSGQRNIAEGFGRFGNKEFAQFARIALKATVGMIRHLENSKGPPPKKKPEPEPGTRNP